jgi:VanZ family protein
MSAPDSSPRGPRDLAASFVRDWLPVVGWMAFILVGSTDAFSSGHTSRFIGPFLRWLSPGLPDAAVGSAVFWIRKAAHLTEYAVLAALWWRALRRPVRRDPRPWSWPVAGQALLASALWAAADEIHQAFTLTRGASVRDVALDAAGATLGLFLLWRAWRWCGGAPTLRTSLAAPPAPARARGEGERRDA